MGGWFEDGEYIPDLTEATDEELEELEAREPEWRPDFIDQADIERKRRKEEG